MPIHEYAEEMMKTEKLCTEEHAPKCRARCPLHVDVREICRLLQTGGEGRARELFASAAALPCVTAKSCDAPCKNACRRRDVDDSVSIGALERYLTSDPQWQPRSLSIRFRSRHQAAVIGAGASGLTAAQNLVARGFLVTLLEADPSAGTHLIGRNGVTRSDIDRDIAAFSPLVSWKFSSRVDAGMLEALCGEYEAVLLTGDLPLPEAICGKADPFTLRVGETNLFLAGRKQLGISSFSESLCSGKRAAVSMERLMKGLSMTAMRVHEDAYETNLYTSIDQVTHVPPLPEEGVYTPEGARSEAARCLDCHCMECVKECVFMQKFGRFPRLYIREIANTISLLRDGIRSGKNLMVACSFCGLCTKLCSNGIPMDKVAHDGRRAMVQKGELSDAIYDFPVRDMLFSNGDGISLCRHAPGKTASRRVFFPGCQLAADNPDIVLTTYRHLLSMEPETGLFLGCCGAPADWSGRERLYEETMDGVKEKLSALGNPEVVCACPTCLKQFQAAGIQAVSLYSLLDSAPLPDLPRNPCAVAVHDSCAARDEQDTQSAVRKLLVRCGYRIEELAMSGEKTRCCGYGGLVFYGDRDVAKQMIENRAGESLLPYVSYCTVCRDYLARAGKPGLHVLDILFGRDAAANWTMRGASLSEKEANRARLSRQARTELYGDVLPPEPPASMKLYLTDPVSAVLEDRLIPERILREVISAAEESKKRLLRPSDGHFIASLRPGIITYWVEYAPYLDGYAVYNAYSHRVEISEAQI